MSRKRSPLYSESVQRQAVQSVLVKGQSQVAVSRRLRCSGSTIRRWLHIYRHEFESPAFAAVSVKEPVSKKLPVGSVEIITPSGFTLRLSDIVSFSQLSELLRSLESQC